MLNLQMGNWFTRWLNENMMWTAMSMDCEKLQRRQARIDHYGRFTTATI
jgi:hypothetical protein